MNELSKFVKPESVLYERIILGKELIIYGSLENPYFLNRDVGKMIRHGNPIVTLKKDGKNGKKTKIPLLVKGEVVYTSALTEYGLMEVLDRSRNPKASLFKEEIVKILGKLRNGASDEIGVSGSVSTDVVTENFVDDVPLSSTIPTVSVRTENFMEAFIDGEVKAVKEREGLENSAKDGVVIDVTAGVENKAGIQLFENREFGNIRVLMIDDDPWFVGKDVTNILGYQNGSRDINRHVDEEDRHKTMVFDGKQNKETILINESGLYTLIISSKLPSAKKFKRWVTSEVLPSIRKHGGYMTATTIDKIFTAPDYGIQFLTKLKEEMDARKALEDKVAVDKTKVEIYDEFIDSNITFTTTQIAKDYGMTAMALNDLLREKKIQFKTGGVWSLYGDYADRGLTENKVVRYVTNNGFEYTSQMLWTARGREFIHHFLKKLGIYRGGKRRKVNAHKM